MSLSILHETLEALIEGKSILYPTDTVWGLGCDATNFDAVSAVYKIKKREESKSLIVLVSSIEMLLDCVNMVPEKALALLSKSKKPTTIIYRNPKNLSTNCIASDNTIAIRIVQDEFCKQLIAEFGKPIVSTSANISGDDTPKSFSEISKTILHSVDYIVNLQQDKIANTSSRILRITENNEVEVIRE
ncbi:MAG: threonylcarbamoyl-AMP synthase [Flavobacteriaceae bacterium]|nr:threonylcarbamoyl-AMP synthase [Flavobacteriaceae bacterium]